MAPVLFNNDDGGDVHLKTTLDEAYVQNAPVNGHHKTTHDKRFDGHDAINGVDSSTKPRSSFEPVAICGMACRLPGGVSSPAELWEFLLAGRDGRGRVPASRYNIKGHYSSSKRPGTVDVEHGYFLDETIDLAGIDTSFTAMGRSELEMLDPQQRLLLEVAREALHDAAVTNWAGSETGVYIGTFGEDWHDRLRREDLLANLYALTGSQDYMASARVSHELDLQGPNMTFRTACSSSMVALNEACAAIAKGDCESAVVGGSNLIMAPNLSISLSGQGVLSTDGSSRSLSANANGYARGEGVVAVYIKSLAAALRDGNPIRSVIAACAANSDGRTMPLSMPSAAAQAKLIRRTYELAGLSDVGKTALFECHATGTVTGDPIECAAIADVFGHVGVHLGTVKPNMGHSEAASGLTAVLKATLALEHRTIPPNIKYAPLNPRIPFQSAKLSIPAEPTPWPADRDERISVNSFGIGGSNTHAILESPARFLPPASSLPPPVQAQDVPQDDAQDDAQLLLFSANTAPALKHMCHDYQTMFETPTHAIADIAYTLANGREHLSHRSYAVASTTTYAPGVSPSTPASKSPAVKPHVVFVFTGQGAAWPQMARDLILSNPTFARTIDSLDKHLGLLGADWTLRDELLKPARTSRVYNAEFSQPLCTALQLGLIDVLAHIGVLPQAVVGHSSGEIAAAYAAGALTAKEAIAVAFHRGAVTKGQTETGGMAAVGLGSDEVQQYLVPGVTMACDNSPSSVTLSGDADKLTDVMARISQARPDVPVTRLKVDKAYHSHHMTAFGEAYHQTMLGSSVVGSLPTIPFFSSVTGGLLGNTKNNRLTPRYWQSNLERPVLFKDAVQAILKSSVVENPILLELGPHSALAGPLRQNLAATSSNAVYIASLLRRQNNRENLLHTIGKLYTSYVALDFGALVTNPASLVAGLPRYPWDHAQRFWYESRLCKEWLDKKHVHHPLLGLQVTTSSEMEPSWRNLLSPKYTPWIAHHKLGDLIVFPLAGFVSVAAEAGRQVSGIDDGVSIRNLTVHNALVIDGESPTELVTTLRRERLTDTLASTWWEFTISSYNGHTWTKHTTGEVRGETLDSQSPCTEESPRLPRKVDSNNFYEAVRQEGLDYGPSFHTMRNVRTDTKSMTGTTTIQNNQWGDEEHYHVHPVVLDTYFQLMSCAIVKGIGRDYQRMVAAKIELITMFRCVEDELHIFNAAEGSSEGYIANGWVSAGVKKALNISGSHCHIFHEDTIIENPISSAARSTWVRHIDFQDNRKLIREPLSHVKCIPLLDELALIAIALLSRATQGTDVHVPRLVKFKEWLSQNSPSHLADVDVASLIQQVESLAKKLENTPAAALASTITTITRSIDSILRGETIDDHGVMMGFLREHDDKDYLRASAYTKPNMGVLILGVEPEDDISGALDCFRRADGQALCSQIVIASGSASSSNTIIDKCKMAPNASISVLDVNNDLAEQGFENQQFDLIIARNVLSASEDIPRSLQNVHRLLRPNGMLLLQEPRPGLLWANLISGTLSHPWSNAEDLDRISEPFISAEAWQEALLSAGFSGIDYVKSTSEHWPNHILTARPRAAETPSKKLTVLAHSAKFAETHCIVTELMNRGYTIDCRSLGESLPSGQDIVALLEEGQPFFDDGDAVKFSQLQSLLQDVGDNGIFWITRLSSVACKNPKYAQIVGLARAVRSETAIDFAVLETEQVISGTNVSAVISVLDKFQTREDDGLLGPDYEFAIHNGETLVHRIFPFSIEDEKVVQQELSEAIVTQQHPGRLNSLTWSSRSPVLPQDDEIEVAIHATGLNFKDVLVGMQIIPGKEPKFGGEASGVVRRVGPKVTRVAVGDRVCGIGEHLLSTTALCPEIYFEKLPERLSFIEGACIPMVFVTALYGLRDIGRLSKGQSVLIHCGAGGVGLAAIQVARLLGAEIYTTVGSEDKVKCLTDTCNVPRERIFNSRDSSFVQGVLRETNGRGVDVVLNSLAGELLHATWKCVARWGTMVEIGKRDILGNGRLDMSPFLDNRSYSCFDIHLMGRERPELLNQLLKFVMDCFDQGQFEPIRVDKVFPASQTLDAVRYMQQGKHIGKIVIEIQDRVGHRLIDEVDTNKKIDAGLDSTGSYLLVGGLGGLGRTMAVWMAQRGARFFIFLSRSAGTGPHDLDLVVELESMGCHIQLVRGDVSEPSDVARAVGGRVAPLRGVIQMSMVLRDQMFDGMSFEDWNVVVNPKVKGTWNLHNATIASGCDLDFFVLFSSLSGIVGQVGQANYASANTFLDAFVHYRVAQNLPCTAIDLGAVGGIGYLADNPDLFKKMQGTGWSVVQETELLDALPLAFMSPTIRSQRSQGIAMGDTFILGLAPTVPLSSPNSSARLKRDVRIAAYHNMDRNDNKAQSSTPDTLGAFLAASKKDPSLFKSTETVELLGREVGKKLCSLVLADDTDLSMTANVSDLGLDSLVAVEMRGWWKLTFGFDISTLDMLGLGTLESMGKRLAEQFITKYNV